MATTIIITSLLGIGSLYEYFYLSLIKDITYNDWSVQLTNNEVLEVYTPHLHKAVRGFYDKYGFPVAKLIKKQWIADIVYFIMKPLEWLFVIVLYTIDVHPENRIAVQYMGKVPEYRH